MFESGRKQRLRLLNCPYKNNKCCTLSVHHQQTLSKDGRFPHFSDFKLSPSFRQSISMHSYTKAMLLGMAVAATARSRPQRTHVKRDTCLLDTVVSTSASDIAASINQCNNDVNTVNSFLNDAASGALPTGADLQSRTITVFDSAQDEPCQLQTLANIIQASNAELVSLS